MTILRQLYFPHLTVISSLLFLRDHEMHCNFLRLLHTALLPALVAVVITLQPFVSIGTCGV